MQRVADLLVSPREQAKMNIKVTSVCNTNKKGKEIIFEFKNK